MRTIFIILVIVISSSTFFFFIKPSEEEVINVFEKRKEEVSTVPKRIDQEKDMSENVRLSKKEKKLLIESDNESLVDRSYPLLLAIDAGSLSTEITTCVKARRDNQGQICREVIERILKQIKTADLKGLKLILNKVGAEDDPWVREDLWNIVASYSGELASKAIFEFYFDMSSGKQPSTAFYPIVADRFAKIATESDIKMTISALVSNNPRDYKRAYSLLNNIQLETYPLLLEEVFESANENLRKVIFLKIVEADSVIAFQAAQRILSSQVDTLTEDDLIRYINRLKFMKNIEIKELAIQGSTSDDRGVRLASYAVLQNFMDDDRVINLLKELSGNVSVK